VLIDGDDRGVEIVSRLRHKYGSTWDASRFITLTKHDFEGYYPPRFAADAATALGEPNRRMRRELKRQLLDDVRAWIADEPKQARSEFAESAGEVIEVLQSIETELFGPG
jgi:hypothetical protein